MITNPAAGNTVSVPSRLLPAAGCLIQSSTAIEVKDIRLPHFLPRSSAKVCKIERIYAGKQVSPKYY